LQTAARREPEAQRIEFTAAASRMVIDADFALTDRGAGRADLGIVCSLRDITTRAEAAARCSSGKCTTDLKSRFVSMARTN
jgi:hypothetical protein